jgi:hypothetical protein
MIIAKGDEDCWRVFATEGERSQFRELLDRFALLHERDADYVEDGGFGHDHPRAAFFEAIIDIWMSAGGRLRRSRHSVTEEPQGPLLRYLQAVTAPVMGKTAPRPETILKLISRAFVSPRWISIR